MKTRPNLPHQRFATCFLAAVLAGIIATSLLASVAELFQRTGTPMERLVSAQHACAGEAHVSERDEDCKAQ